MKTFKKLLKEIANIASSGAVSGMGYNVGKPDQPQVSGRDADDVKINPKKRKRDKFAGCEVFKVSTEEYNNCLRGRSKYERWNRKLNMENINNQDIRSFAHRNPGKPIIIQDEATGIMTYLIPPKIQ
tara:strand:+ start:288 stop:668 length:381 start_codon:yes stop_codon:yes gene_type:complete